MISLVLAIFNAEAAPIRLWQAADHPGFESPIAVSDGRCDGDEPRFSPKSGVPMFCPAPGAWPPVARTWRTDAVAWGAETAPQLLSTLPVGAYALEQSWRNAMFIGPTGAEGSASDVPLAETARWAYADGVQAAGVLGDVTIGTATSGGGVCTVVSVAGTWRLDGDCAPAADAASMHFDLFPVHPAGSPDTIRLLQVDVPLVAAPVATPAAPSARQAAFVGLPVAGLFGAGGLAIGAAAAFALTRRRAPAPEAEPAPTQLADPPPPPKRKRRVTPKATVSAPAPERPAEDVAWDRQKALLALPKLRSTLEGLVTAPWVDRHLKAAEALRAAAQPILADAVLPSAWRDTLREAIGTVDAAADHVDTLRSHLRTVLAGKDDAEAREFLSLRLPDTTVRVTDDGEALAEQFRMDVIRDVLVPYITTGQLFTEAVPKEIGRAVRPLKVIEHAHQVADALGLVFEPLPLYEHKDSEFMLDREVALTGIDADSLWHGLPPPEGAAPGVIVRVIRPRFRQRGSTRPLRAHFVMLKEDR